MEIIIQNLAENIQKNRQQSVGIKSFLHKRDVPDFRKAAAREKISQLRIEISDSLQAIDFYEKGEN